MFNSYFFSRHRNITAFLENYVNKRLKCEILSISNEAEYMQVLESIKKLPTRKLMSVTHALMDWVNQAKLKSQRYKNSKKSVEDERDFLLLPSNIIFTQLDVQTIHGGKTSFSC